MLDQLDIFAPLGDEALKELVAASDCWFYPRGQEMDRPPDQEPNLFVILSGIVRIWLRSAAGKEFRLLLLGPGKIFDLDGELPIGMEEAVAQAMATWTVICCIPREAFERITAACPAGAVAVMRAWREQNRALREVAGDRLYSTAGRARRSLWRYTRQNQEHSVWYTREDFARQVGTDRSTITTTVGKLAGEGLIELDVEDHRITVVDEEGLISGE
jgi:CRP-like cAMP-binding protein